MCFSDRWYMIFFPPTSYDPLKAFRYERYRYQTSTAWPELELKSRGAINANGLQSLIALVGGGAVGVAASRVSHVIVYTHLIFHSHLFFIF